MKNGVSYHSVLKNFRIVRMILFRLLYCCW